MTATIKDVSWTITGAQIIPGVKNPTGDQPILRIAGTIKRSDSKSAQKGPFAWTPNRVKAGYTLDVSGFNAGTGTGTIIVSGSIRKNGRKGSQPLAGADLLSRFGDLFAAPAAESEPKSK